MDLTYLIIAIVIIILLVVLFMYFNKNNQYESIENVDDLSREERERKLTNDFVKMQNDFLDKIESEKDEFAKSMMKSQLKQLFEKYKKDFAEL